MNKFKSVVLLSLVGSQVVFSAGNANVYAPNAILHLRGQNALLIALNPVQHQAFADEINGLEQQLADNNIDYGLLGRIDELGAQIEEALVAAPPRVNMVDFLFDPNF